ncbi:MAG: nucleotide pyrophosphohydrolase [Anaerolineae bacterium]|nr:nucleotide pyrophosphohydrolase [Anaerolineae bacterium]MBL6965595.1 nucleotide pyrophosphohydrolase [Anaerolineales bacterium]
MPPLNYQQIVREFTQEHQLQISTVSRLLDLVSELGEVAKDILESTHYGREAFQPSESWDTELGDTFFSLICLANGTQVNLDTALTQVLKKYQLRIAQKGSAASDATISSDVL